MIFGLESIAKISDDYVMLNRNVNKLQNFSSHIGTKDSNSEKTIILEISKWQKDWKWTCIKFPNSTKIGLSKNKTQRSRPQAERTWSH